MFLRKSFNSLPILAMVCGVRACKPVSYYPPILSNALVIGVIQCHVSGTEDGLSNILFQLVHNHNDAACPQAGGEWGLNHTSKQWYSCPPPAKRDLSWFSYLIITSRRTAWCRVSAYQYKSLPYERTKQ